MRSNSILQKQKASRSGLLLREFAHLFVESSQPMLHYVVPEHGWSVDWTGYHVTRWVQKLGMQAQMTNRPPRVRGDILHYADAESLLKNIEYHTNDRNWLVSTILHGDRSDDNPEMEQVMTLSEDLNSLVVTTETMFERFTEWGVREDKLVCIPLGVDLNSFFPASTEEKLSLRQKFGVPEDAFCIGSFQKDGLGWDEGLEPLLVKGPDIFLDTIEKVKKDIPSLFVFLTGPARGFVKQGLDALGVPYCHHYVDAYQEVRDCYACLDACIITSREDGGPNALLESMACGAPVVGMSAGMVKDVVQHAEDGLKCDVEDVEQLAELIITLKDNPELASLIAVNGMETAREYDWSVIAGLYFEHVYAPLMVQRYS